MRIIAGKWHGRALVAPKGDVTRPTSDRAREALFSMLVSRIGSFEGLKVADLFAGTGALGLEALSRGAAHCTFVEQDRYAIDAIRSNIAKLGAQADVRAQAAESYAGGPYDIVFVDAPYGSGLGQRALSTVRLAPGGLASLETARDEVTILPGYSIETEKRYGKAKLTLLRRD